MWQTNFPINNHTTIRNEYLDWESECQRQVAQKAQIPVFDLAEYVNSHQGSVQKDDYHLSFSGQKFIVESIDKAIQ